MNVTVDVNKVELNVQTNSASIEFEVHINKSTVVDQIQSDLSETDESKKSFVLGKDEFIAQIKEDLAREFSVTIERQDVVFEYGKVKILHDLNFNTQYKVVNPELIVNFGEGTKYLSPVLSYPSAETNTSSPFRGFYVIDADNILNEFSEFDYIKFSYDVVADTDVKYDCPVENLGNGVVFEESGFWHSRGGVATFNAVYPENTSEKFETVEDPLVWGSLTQAYTPKYCAIKGADLISYPYVAGATVDAVGSNPNILSVASHYSNNFERHDITPNETTFLKNTIAVGARLNNAGTDNTGATSYGYGVEFFEVANRPNLNEQYPGDVTIIDSDGVPHIYNGLGSAWWSYPASVQFAQSPTCAIIAAKFRKIKDATGASWALCREAARATASNNGVWDMYRGFGIVNPEAAIAYIQAKDKTYLIDKIEAENDKYNMLEYEELKDNTPVPKKHVEAIKETIPVLPAFGDIITHDADEFAISNHNHSLENLTERSYNSLTDKPNLDAYIDVINVQWWSDDVPEDVVEGDIYYSPLAQEIYVKQEIVWQQIPFDWKFYCNQDPTSDFYGKYFVFNGTELSIIPDGLVLGETASTAFDGLRGKTAYDHSLITGNPHGTTASQVGAYTKSEVNALIGDINTILDDINGEVI